MTVEQTLNFVEAKEVGKRSVARLATPLRRGYWEHVQKNNSQARGNGGVVGARATGDTPPLESDGQSAPPLGRLAPNVERTFIQQRYVGVRGVRAHRRTPSVKAHG